MIHKTYNCHLYIQGHSVRTFLVNTLKPMFKLITLYRFLYFLAEEGGRKQVSKNSVSLIISDIHYPGSFNEDELLKIALLWGKYDDIENETARIDKVRW